MRVLLDTSYFMPLIKVQVKDIPASILQNLLSNPRVEIHYCDITLFELAAKAMHLIVSGEPIDIHDVRIGIDAIENETRFERDQWTKHPYILELTASFRKIHTDFIDCLILATAVCYAEAFATLDNEIYQKILKEPSIIHQILDINAQFQFWFGDLSKTPIMLEES